MPHKYVGILNNTTWAWLVVFLRLQVRWAVIHGDRAADQLPGCGFPTSTGPACAHQGSAGILCVHRPRCPCYAVTCAMGTSI